MGKHVIRANGIDGAQVFHAIQVDPDQWHWSGPDWGGVMIATRQSLITSLADLIGAGNVYNLVSSYRNQFLVIDRAGNVWVGKDYLSPHQYLPGLVPEADDG